MREASVVRDEPLGSQNLTAQPALSRDGDRFAWAESDGVVVEELSTGRRLRIPLSETPTAVGFGPDGQQLAIVLPTSFTLWKLPGLEPVWSVPNPSSIPAAIAWSADGSTILVAYEAAGALLLDARTGEPLGRVVEGHAGAGASQVNVLPSLKHRLSRTGSSWALAGMPGPDTSAPAESLRSVLQQAGFRLRGVDLEVVSP